MNIVSGYNDNPVEPQTRLICRFYQRGMCRFGNRCRNIHGEVETTKKLQKGKTSEKKDVSTSLAKSPTISPSSALHLSKNNTKKALTNEFGPSTSSTTLAENTQSSNRTCGICFDAIVEKRDKKEQLFGLLPNCNHCFCFTCIRKWRQSKEFDFDVSKACPECRVASNYVYPSKIWFEIKEDKENFISKENLRMQKFDCRYFKKGSGTCPFGNTCLYLHALRNGKKMDVGPPRPRKRRTSHLDHELANQILYWLNDEDDLDLDDDDDDDYDNDFELDLDDPTIAMQYYDHDDIRRYIAIDRLMNANSDTDSNDDYDFPLFL